jgi:hypothetical protein
MRPILKRGTASVHKGKGAVSPVDVSVLVSEGSDKVKGSMAVVLEECINKHISTVVSSSPWFCFPWFQVLKKNLGPKI